MPRRLFFLLFAIALSSCADKTVSVCGGTGSCCTLAFSRNVEGHLIYNFNQCVPDAGPCPPEHVDQSLVLDRIFPNTQPSEGMCNKKTKKVWIWESEFWSQSMMSPLYRKQNLTATETLNIEETLNLNTAAEAKTSSSLPPLPPVTDKNYCIQACDRADATGGKGLCPTGRVPSDVSVGLLRLIANYAKQPDIPDSVSSLSSVFSAFNISVTDNACKRDDLIISGERIINTGATCETEITIPTDATSGVTATLTLPQSILSDVSAGDGVAIFPTKSLSYDIHFDNPFLNAAYGGSFSAISEGSDGVSVVAKTDANSISPCIRVDPAQQANFAELIESANRIAEDEASLSAALSILSERVAKLEATVDDSTLAGEETESNLSSLYSNPFPFSAEVDRIVKLQSSDAALLDFGAFLESEAKRRDGAQPFTYSTLVTLLDMTACHDAGMTDIAAIDLQRYYPPLDATTAVSSEVLRFRDEQASKLLLCAVVFPKLSEAARNNLRGAVAVLSERP
jgi:hypothetical protein